MLTHASLKGFTNEDSGANKHLSNLTPVTQSSASSVWGELYNCGSDHISPWAIPLITYLATADSATLLLQHWGISPGKERGLHQNILPGVRGGATFTALADSVSWLSCVSPLDITHDITTPPRPGPASAWMLGWLGQFPAGSCLNQLFIHTNNFRSRLCCHNKLKWQLKKPKHLQSLMFCRWLCVVTCVLCCRHSHFGWDETNNKTTNGSISTGTIKPGRRTFPRTQLRLSKCLHYVRRYLRLCNMNMSYNFSWNSQLFAPYFPSFSSKYYN